MSRFKDQAICIRHIDWSETSQVVVLLTQQHGKVRGLAKGSKRTSPSAVARFSGGIELLTLGQIVAVVKRTAELATLTEWDLQNDHHHLRRDLGAQRLALYAGDLVNAMLEEHDPHPKTFAALADLLVALKDSSSRQGALLRFQWVVLEDCGYRPQLWRDVVTDKPLSEKSAYRFDAQAGGLTEAEGVEGVEQWRVRRQTVELLRKVAGGEEKGTLEAGVSPGLIPGVEAGVDPGLIPGVIPGVVQRANRLLCAYVRAILDKELPTMGFVLEEGSAGGR